MLKGTLSLTRSSTVIELPQDYDRLLQSITICAPVQKISLDIDVTHKITLPAILESALLLVAQLEAISPGELGGFFGLTDHERDVLVNEMIDTSLVMFNDEGDISTTKKLIAQRRDNGVDEGITIEDVENFREFTYVDLCTGHIQPRSESDNQPGLPMLPRELNETEFSKILASQFHRFQRCLPDNKSKQSLRSPKARLYRINRASVSQSGLQQQISLDIHACHDPLHGIRLESNLVDYNHENANLMDVSGLKTKATDWLHNRQHEPVTISIQQYCDLAKDTVVERYIRDNETLDLPRLLHDRFRKKTSYGNQNSRMIIGPIYSAANRSTIINWVERQSKSKPMHHGIWLGATNELFGASLGLEMFMKRMNDILIMDERNSSLSLAFHLKPNQYEDQRLLKRTLSYRTDNKLRVFADGVSESHMELLVFPGDNGCALIQYHAKIDPSLGFGGLTIPVGYFTTDPERVTSLWEMIRQRVKSDIVPFNAREDNIETLNKQLKYNNLNIGKIFQDESEQKLQSLLDKFNN
ncbi:hypothetical protein L7750_14880 [Xenorhabdus bovienii]|uniref:hypothetical protein n=1 Tax=Xenorhabdus bovienii TaxID=40576 RepID=UPI001EDF14DB|nr:hypothetical protein [Xenorhabdus bovienii]MCG3471634.1 hypothetical protein [Xenorhabdus bovienii]